MLRSKFFIFNVFFIYFFINIIFIIKFNFLEELFYQSLICLLFSFFYVFLLFIFYKKKKLNYDHVFSFKRGLLILIFIMVSFTGVLSKLNMLFLYDIDGGFNKSSDKLVVMKGYFKTGTSR